MTEIWRHIFDLDKDIELKIGDMTKNGETDLILTDMGHEELEELTERRDNVDPYDMEEAIP